MSILKKNYPFDASNKHHFFIAIAFSIWVFLFLFLIKPLTVNELSIYQQWLYLPIYSIISGASYASVIYIQNRIYNAQNKQWYLGSELILLSSFSVFTCISIWLFYRYIVTITEPTSFSLFFWDIYLPALLIILPLIGVSRYFVGKYQRITDPKIILKGEGNYENIQLFLKDLLYIQSSNNYIEVFFIENNKVKTAVLRNKLSKIESLHPNLIRVHRSYLINPIQYQQWTVEKGKHILVLNYSVKVPVSKTYISKVKLHLNFAPKEA